MARLKAAERLFGRRRPIGAGFSSVISAALVVCATILTVGLIATSWAGTAQAKVVDVEGVRVGLQERSTSLEDPTVAAAFGNPEGRPVLPASKLYAIYWDPESLYYYHGDWERIIDGFMHDMSAGSGDLSEVFAVDGQYTDAAGHHASYDTSFEGAYTDLDAYPATPGCEDPAPLQPGPFGVQHAVTCLTDQQIQEELVHFIAESSLPTGMGTVYYLLTPPGVTTCLDGGGATGHCSDYQEVGGSVEEIEERFESSFCSYHSYIGSELPDGGPKTILYAVIPWSAGGEGDYHLAQEDRKPAYDCQDGGFDPSGIGGEEREELKTSPEPAHQQEPNQLAPGSRGSDGTFDTGLADLIVNQIAVEQQDIVTDPLLNAWQSQDGSGDEAVDECRNFFGPTLGGAVSEVEETKAGTLYNQELDGGRAAEGGGEAEVGHYYLNDAFNLAAMKQAYPGVPCISHVFLEPGFTAPSRVNAGETVGFNGHESNITLDGGVGYDETGTPFTTYPTYQWSFGDGTVKSSSAPAGWNPDDEPNAFHVYAYGGTYQVTLTVTDTAGNTESVTKPVTVVGPPPPPPPPPSSTGSSAGTAQQPGQEPGAGVKGSTGRGAGSGGAAGHGSGSGGSAGKPEIRLVVLTRSLSKALEHGIAVRYSVDQQVAGTIQVLLASRLARKLHIHARKAKSLPKGSAPERVVGGRPLVTARKAHGKVRIVLGAKVAKRLKKLRHLRLTLRMTVHSASAEHPRVARLLTVAKLRR